MKTNRNGIFVKTIKVAPPERDSMRAELVTPADGRSRSQRRSRTFSLVPPVDKPYAPFGT